LAAVQAVNKSAAEKTSKVRKGGREGRVLSEFHSNFIYLLSPFSCRTD